MAADLGGKALTAPSKEDRFFVFTLRNLRPPCSPEVALLPIFPPTQLKPLRLLLRQSWFGEIADFPIF